jgi:hypothetical protein
MSTTVINVFSNIKEASDGFCDLWKSQIPFATSKTLNNMTFNIAKRKLPVDTQNEFAGGSTAFTKRGFIYDKSTKQQLWTTIETNPENQYLALQILGGVRKLSDMKESRNMTLTNVDGTKTTTRAILSPYAKNVASKMTKEGNLNQKPRATIFKRASKNGFVGFLPRKGWGKGAQSKSAGAYVRVGRGKNATIKKMINLTTRDFRYRAKFKFAENVAEGVNAPRWGFAAQFPVEVERAVISNLKHTQRKIDAKMKKIMG